jgi:hypothetical protein
MRVQRKAERERFAIKKLQRKKFNQFLLTQLHEHKLLPEGFSISEKGDIEAPTNCQLKIAVDPTEIDRTAQLLPRILQDALEISCPKTKPSNYARRTWSAACHELVLQRRRAHRWAARTRDRREEKELRNKIKKQIRQDSNHAWRDFVQEASHKPLRKGAIWHLAKWARKSVGKPKSPPSFPLLEEERNMTTQQQTSYKK